MIVGSGVYTKLSSGPAGVKPSNDIITPVLPFASLRILLGGGLVIHDTLESETLSK